MGHPCAGGLLLSTGRNGGRPWRRRFLSHTKQTPTHWRCLVREMPISNSKRQVPPLNSGRIHKKKSTKGSTTFPKRWKVMFLASIGSPIRDSKRGGHLRRGSHQSQRQPCHRPLIRVPGRKTTCTGLNLKHLADTLGVSLKLMAPGLLTLIQSHLKVHQWTNIKKSMHQQRKI